MDRQSSDHDDITSFGTHYVRASDIGSFMYCRRSWWLTRIVGLEPDALLRRQRGTQAHQHHAWFVWFMQILRIISLGLILLAGIAGIGMWMGWW
ncbi:MAG: hypothetical protein ACO3F2_05915 [Roseiflexaceae bacterium]|jgi:hypothetical protein